MKRFAHLHLHTAHSMLDGAVRSKELFERCDKLGIEAVAITDHGNMYGVLEFMKAAAQLTEPQSNPFDFMQSGKPYKVKPIIGCEVYITDDRFSRGSENKNYNHLILLAKNETGYKNLVYLVSMGYVEGLYYKPRIDFDLLSKHSEGLICLSACLAGQIPRCLLRGDMKGADEWAQKYKALFGEDFYIELQDHRIADQRRILPLLRDVAIRHGIKMAATNDVHYLNKEDALMQKVLQNISFGNTMTEGSEFFHQGVVTGESDYFPTDEFYLKSGDEMAELFETYEGALENTIEIAEKCENNFFRKDKLLPPFKPDDGSAPAVFLRRLTEEGLKKKYPAITPEIKERADFELSTIDRLGFTEYFLIVWDFIHFAETSGVSVGPGRGSGAASIVAYAIGITKVDPLQYSLAFERFLNPDRVSNPDFDIDFCMEKRDRVIDYVVNKYGSDNVSQIITFSTLAAKAAVKDVGRVFDRPYAEVDRLTKLMPKLMGKDKIGHLLGLLPSKDGNPVIPELKELYNNDAMAKKILDMAMQIEGLPRQSGMHAAGVIICKDEIYNHIPMAKNGDGIVTTQFNMNECEEVGLLKMDFLGLTTLTDIAKAQEYIKESRGVDIDFYAMEYDDQNVYALMADGDTSAVFQLESEGMSRFMRDLKPNCLEDVIAGVALYRPGPMDKIPEYLKNRRNPEKIRYDTPLLEPILKVTYGIMVYQEQVMQAVRELAGYSMGRADEVRRMMSKKKADAMERERAVFLYGKEDGSVKGCVKNGIDEKTASKIFDDMTSFSSYAFNKAHAAAYAFLTYQTAYLKRYYTAEFITAILNNRITRNDEVAKYLLYLKEKGIAVQPPDINKSYGGFVVENGSVRIGLAALKNVGGSLVSVIVDERKRGGNFSSFEDFVKRMQEVLSAANNYSLNKKLIESLIYSGAFDSLGVNRNSLITCYDNILDRVKKDMASKKTGQLSLFDDAPEVKYAYPDRPEFDPAFKLKMEKEVSGVYLTAHPLEQYAEKLKGFAQNTSMLKPDSEDEYPSYVTLGGMLGEVSVRISKAGKEFGLGVLEDLYGSVELLFLGDKLLKKRESWTPDRPVTVSGRVNARDDGSVTIWVEKVEPWAEEEKTRHGICIYFNSKDDAYGYLNEIKELLADYPGDDEVYVSFSDSDGKKVVNLLDGITVLACKMLKNELAGYTYVVDVKVN